jgi:oxalate decarboxylase/phosphoglucose isomerase-like protein (cupin superfamily)
VPVVRRADVHFTDLPGRRSADPVPGGLGDGYAVRVVRVPDGPRTPHLHPHSDEVTYVVSGTGTAYEGAPDGGDLAPTRVGPGDTIVVPRGAPHATVADAGGELELLCFFPRGDLADNLVELDAPVLRP